MRGLGLGLDRGSKFAWLWDTQTGLYILHEGRFELGDSKAMHCCQNTPTQSLFMSKLRASASASASAIDGCHVDDLNLSWCFAGGTHGLSHYSTEPKTGGTITAMLDDDRISTHQPCKPPTFLPPTRSLHSLDALRTRQADPLPRKRTRDNHSRGWIAINVPWEAGGCDGQGGLLSLARLGGEQQDAALARRSKGGGSTALLLWVDTVWNHDETTGFHDERQHGCIHDCACVCACAKRTLLLRTQCAVSADLVPVCVCLCVEKTEWRDYRMSVSLTG